MYSKLSSCTTAAPVQQQVEKIQIHGQTCSFIYVGVDVDVDVDGGASEHKSFMSWVQNLSWFRDVFPVLVCLW